MVGNSFCYPCYPLQENDDLFICIRYTDEDSEILAPNKFHIQKQNIISGDIHWTFDLEEENLLCKPVLFNDKLNKF